MQWIEKFLVVPLIVHLAANSLISLGDAFFYKGAMKGKFWCGIRRLKELTFIPAMVCGSILVIVEIYLLIARG